MRLLLALILLLPAISHAQKWKAGATLSGWTADSSIATGGTVAQTGDRVVPYNMHRRGEFTLSAPIVNGRYTVRLHFREPSAAVGQRVFHVELEGTRVETSLDVAKLAGSNHLVRTYTADIADGTVSVRFVRVTGEPMYSAIDVSLVAPGPPTGPTWTGSQGLSWTPPTQNSDGTALTDLAGYVIQYGNTAALGQQVILPEPGLTSYVLTGLPQGRWYVGMRAVNTAGTQSDLSNIVEFQLTESVPACPSKPADETQVTACTAPAVGSWTQTRTYEPAVYPTCWTASAWLPAAAPSGACVVPPPPATWKVRSASSGTSPAYELIRNQADTAWARGYKLGDVDVDKPCGETREIPGTTEYHRVTESDVVLLSPTYRGRTLVAVCARH